MAKTKLNSSLGLLKKSNLGSNINFLNKSKMKIGAKLIILVVAVNVIGIMILTSLLLNKAANLQEDSAFEKAKEMGYHHGTIVQVDLEVAMDAARTLAQTFKALRKRGPVDRNMIGDILKGVLNDNPAFVGAYTLWEPNALDGKDALYINRPGHDKTGRYIPYFNRGSGKIIVEPLVDYQKDGAGDYYQVPKKTKNEAIIDPYLYPIAGKEVLITSLVVPIIINDRVYGMAGIDVTLVDLAVKVNKIKPYGTGYASLISNTGLCVTHPDEKRMGKPSKEKEGFGAIKRGKEFSFINNSSTLRTDVYRIFIPVQIGKTTTPWSMEIILPMDKVLAPIRAMRIFAIIIIIIVVGATSIIIYFISRSITNPIKESINVANKISGGDLSVHPPKEYLDRNDEIGELSNSLKNMTDKVKDVVGNVWGSSNSLVDASEQINSAAQGLSNSSNNQAANVEEITSSLEEIMASISQNTENAKNTDAIAQQASGQAEEGGAAVSETAESMMKISEKITLIEEIASQTNLLALNAAIEAARAGEQGKGFAVVAGEVRKLAEKSQIVSQEISELASSSVDVSKKAGSLLQEIVPSIKNTAELVQGIAVSSEEMDMGVKQIGKGMEQLNELTQDNSSSSEELNSTSETLKSQAEQLKEMMQFFKLS